MGDLQPVRMQRHGELDHGIDMLDILPVDDGIDRQRRAAFAHPAGEGKLLFLDIGHMADPDRRIGLGILEADLHVIQAGIDQRHETLAGDGGA